MTIFEILFLCLLLALLVLALGWMLTRRRDRGTPQSEEGASSPAIAEIRGQLSQLATAASGQQQSLSSQLHEQSKKLEEQMAHLRQHMGQSLHAQTQSLHEQTKTTNENLGKLSERLVVIDQASQHISALNAQVSQLHNILANKTERGAFGEVQLENLVRTVLPPNAFEFQVTLSNGKRADCVLKLPNPPGDIIIDAKFPLESWRALQVAENEAERILARKRLATAVRGHVKDIADKYIIPGETADSACLFLPSEAVYAELHAHLPEVIENSFRRRVWIVSPTTMMATLNTVRAILRDAHMREQTAVIQGEIGKMIADVGRLEQRVDSLDKHFALAQKDVQQIQISTGKITNRGEKIESLEVEDAPAEVGVEPDANVGTGTPNV